MVTHNVQPKWFPWEPKSYDMSIISVLASIQSMMKSGLKVMKIQSKVALFTNTFSKTVIVP